MYTPKLYEKLQAFCFIFFRRLPKYPERYKLIGGLFKNNLAESESKKSSYYINDDVTVNH